MVWRKWHHCNVLLKVCSISRRFEEVVECQHSVKSFSWPKPRLRISSRTWSAKSRWNFSKKCCQTTKSSPFQLWCLHSKKRFCQPTTSMQIVDRWTRSLNFFIHMKISLAKVSLKRSFVSRWKWFQDNLHVIHVLAVFDNSCSLLHHHDKKHFIKNKK